MFGTRNAVFWNAINVVGLCKQTAEHPSILFMDLKALGEEVCGGLI
jgi:hypothetical protein